LSWQGLFACLIDRFVFIMTGMLSGPL